MAANSRRVPNPKIQRSRKKRGQANYFSAKNLILEENDSLIFAGNHEKVYQALNWMEEKN
jgi:hypothetical protein